MAPLFNVPRGDASSISDASSNGDCISRIRDPYERLETMLWGEAVFEDGPRQYMRRRFIVLARRLDSAPDPGHSLVADEAEQNAVTEEEMCLAEAIIGSMTDEDVMHMLVDMENETRGVSADEDEDEDEWENGDDIEYEPALDPDGPPEIECDPEEGEPVPRTNMALVKKKLAHISDLITEKGYFLPSLNGTRLPKNYNASHIERLLAQAGCYPADTHLTPEELQSETVAAWLREFDVYPPGVLVPPRPTGQAPPIVGTRNVQIPTRIGYSSPTITTFVQHHLRLLMPSHPRYPMPDDRCILCMKPYGRDRPPILIENAGACRGHMFCNECLRGHLKSNSAVCHKCPTCRTRWFRPRRYEMREVMRSWDEADRREQAAAAREEDAFGGEPPRVEPQDGEQQPVEAKQDEQQRGGAAEQDEILPVEDSRRQDFIEGVGMVAGAVAGFTWDAAVLAVRNGAAGARWMYRKMGRGNR
jgi:hypothetical protein